MTLAEKIAALRGERKLSQGDVAERLEVSRQSVSKWETGQAVPELDKIIRLADLFGVSVDELVRGEAVPRPETLKPEATERVVYIGKPPKGLTPVQVLGVTLLVLGLLGVILGAAVSGNAGTYTALAGAGMVVLGLPFTLARKHPFLAAGWAAAAVSCLIFNPYTSIAPWGLSGGASLLYAYLTIPTAHYSTLLLGAAIGIVRGLLFLALSVCTGRLCWEKWKSRGQRSDEAAGRPQCR